MRALFSCWLLHAAAVRGLLIVPASRLLPPSVQPQRHATALATASEAVATSAPASASADGSATPALGFSFTPGGLLFPYYVGAAYELQRLGLLTPNAPLGGSSAGAIVATAVASGLTEAEILDGLSVLVSDYRGGTSLRASLRKQLERLLPDDAPQRCEAHGLVVCYRWPCVWVRGGLALDGFFALPREEFGAPTLAARRTVVISALPKVKVAPRGGLLQPGAGTRFPLGVEDAAWFERALKPATDAQLDEMVALGRAHAASWAAEDAETQAARE